MESNRQKQISLEIEKSKNKRRKALNELIELRGLLRNNDTEIMCDFDIENGDKKNIDICAYCEHLNKCKVGKIIKTINYNKRYKKELDELIKLGYESYYNNRI